MKKLLTLLVAFSFIFASGAAQVFAAAPDGSGPWADFVVSSTQGMRRNGTAVLPARSNPDSALGVAETTGAASDPSPVDGTFYSLGFGGTITLRFDNAIANDVGNDVMVYEVTGGTYPDEQIDVLASHNGTDWVLIGDNVARDEALDLGILPCARYIQITDVSNPNLFEPTADGFDLDGVEALHNTSACNAVSSINIDKTADQTSITPGQTVNYTYTVTNTGSFALDTVSVQDTHCSPVVGPTGDTNGDSILQTTETWVYTCSQALTQTTTNVGTVTANDPWDHPITDNDDHTVTVALGCTYTQGYWKNHSAGSNHYNSTWDEITNANAWVTILNTPVKGNAWYQLAHQYIAARLNILSGAYASPEVTAAMTQAEALVGDATPEEVSKADKAMYVNLAGILGSFNEGLTVTPHCAE